MSSYIWYARGGSQGWLEIPDWFPSRASTGLIIFSAMLYHFSAPLTWWDITVLFFIPYVWNLFAQSLGHGSYMDAGYWNRPDVQGLRWLLKPVAFALDSDRSAAYDYCGGLLKGLIMTMPIMALWMWYFSSLAPLFLIVVAFALPTTWFINNRWYKSLQQTSLWGAPVYWAELFFGFTYGFIINVIAYNL